MRYYLDTSAAAKLLAKEAETDALVSFLDDAVQAGHSLLSSFLLETELRRFAVRHNISQLEATAVLERVELLLPDRAWFREAGTLPGTTLRSLDALHVAAALRLEVDRLITYDLRQSEAANQAGIRVLAPAPP